MASTVALPAKTPEQRACAGASLTAMDARAAERAAKVRAEQKAAWLAEKAKRGTQKPVERSSGAPLQHYEGQPEIIAAVGRQPIESASPPPKRLGLRDLKQAFRDRQAAQAAAVAGGAP
jgi:hypothetical protein